jgi:hypothetical protein
MDTLPKMHFEGNMEFLPFRKQFYHEKAGQTVRAGEFDYPNCFLLLSIDWLFPVFDHQRAKCKI